MVCLKSQSALYTGIQLESPIAADVRSRLSGCGGPGTLLWLVARMKRVSPSMGRSLLDASMQLSKVGGNSDMTLALRGLLRVLVVDDQRTMRQMVATLFQRLCQANSELRVELHTAISGEQAVRACSKRRYHIVTMDEQLSESYCRAFVKEHCDRRQKRGEPQLNEPDNLSPALYFDGNRVTNAARRLAFFDAEIEWQSPLVGDGAILGHTAIEQMRHNELEKSVIFNLTGNVLECDRTKYLESGSNGVLPKPIKLEDLTSLLEQSIPDMIQTDICEIKGDTIFFKNDPLQIGTKLTPPAGPVTDM